MANYPGTWAERQRRIQEEFQKAMEDLFEEANHEQSGYTSFNRDQGNYRFNGNRQFGGKPAAFVPSRAFQVLGLQPGASKDEIKKAYRKKAMLHHPDRGGDPKKFHEVQDAYESLAT